MSLEFSFIILIFFTILVLVCVLDFTDRLFKSTFSNTENQYLSKIYFHKSCIAKRQKDLNQYDFELYNLKVALKIQKEIEL
jgi:hypothetical protein